MSRPKLELGHSNDPDLAAGACGLFGEDTRVPELGPLPRQLSARDSHTTRLGHRPQEGAASNKKLTYPQEKERGSPCDAGKVKDRNGAFGGRVDFHSVLWEQNIPIAPSVCLFARAVQGFGIPSGGIYFQNGDIPSLGMSTFSLC
ncbi:hypothetical protein E4U47_008153 [Claviceps purpurea]|nr:hypothetical protein E4U47_008153 [Claviceps purpurea]